MSGTEIGLAISVFLACAVEAVEALTIVLAVGITRGWARALLAALCALVVLAAAVAGDRQAVGQFGYGQAGLVERGPGGFGFGAEGGQDAAQQQAAADPGQHQAGAGQHVPPDRDRPQHLVARAGVDVSLSRDSRLYLA